MASTVHVKGIGSQTTNEEVRAFFSFCGKISSLSVTPDADGSKSAEVTFEKETAAKTALLLDSTQLGQNQVKVTGDQSLDKVTPPKTVDQAGDSTTKEDDLSQEDKPRSRIAAEYLAHGYVLSDVAIQRALDLDKQHGISNRFTNVLTQFDAKFNATERAQALDKKFAVTERANQGWLTLNSYFEQAANTPTGQRLRAFYEQGQKQVLDVHNEAKHLAELKKNDGKPVTEQAKEAGQAATEQAQQTAQSVSEKAQQTFSDVSQKAQQTASDISKKASETAAQANEKATQ